MSTNYVEEGSQRSDARNNNRPRRRRGGSSRSGSRSESRSRRDDDPTPRRDKATPPKKAGFLEKVVAFLTGKKVETKPARTRRPAKRPEIAPGSTAPAAAKPERKRRGGMRTPEEVEVTTPRVYVGNLSFDATESDLFDLFNGVGIVQNAEVVSNSQTQRSKGFGFVTLQSVEEAKRAVQELHDKEFMGRKLVVSGAKASDRREDRESSRDSGDPAIQPEQ